MIQRLDKLLGSQGMGSRKEIARLVRRGCVLVDGAPAGDPAQKVDPQSQQIVVSGKPVVYREHLYLMMNKPAGVLSATEDSRQRTVLDLLPPEFDRRGLFPAGRLDKDTTGLLLLTDDGAFAHRMLSPRSHVFKRYRATLERAVTPEDVALFARGITAGGETFVPARLFPAEDPAGKAAFVEIREGKFHQVKRMFEAAGNRVLALHRCAIGGLVLDEDLAPGAVRLLEENEEKQVFIGQNQQKQEI